MLDRHYADAAGGGYFMTSDDHEALLAREKPAYDGAEPSGNSVALMNLLRLHELTTDDGYRVPADKLLRAFAGTIRGSAEMLLALDFRLDSPKEIVIVTAGDRGRADPFLEALAHASCPPPCSSWRRKARISAGSRGWFRCWRARPRATARRRRTSARVEPASDPPPTSRRFSVR